MPKHVPRIAAGLALMLAGCGTHVPDIQENPWYPDPDRLVVAIVGSIHCELRNAITWVINADRQVYWGSGRRQPLQAGWLNKWGAQVQITLSVDEQTAFGPTGAWSPTHIFSLFGGANISAEATRVETLNYYYTVPELYGSGKGCSPSTIANLAVHPAGSLLIQSDLKLREWLSAVVESQGVGDISIARNNSNAKNAITHQVTFRIVTGGNITPTWTLVHAVINPVVPLLAASRNRTNDLLITLGPNVESANGANSLGIGTPAADANLAAQIGLSIGNRALNNAAP